MEEKEYSFIIISCQTQLILPRGQQQSLYSILIKINCLEDNLLTKKYTNAIQPALKPINAVDKIKNQ
jgi:hypothetical protein